MTLSSQLSLGCLWGILRLRVIPNFYNSRVLHQDPEFQPGTTSDHCNLGQIIYFFGLGGSSSVDNLSEAPYLMYLRQVVGQLIEKKSIALMMFKKMRHTNLQYF